MDAAVVLRDARRRAGMSQAVLAAQAATSQAAISAYESGAKEPSVATLSRLLAATGARLDVRPAGTSVVTPSAAQLSRAGRTLEQVIELAEALPVRHAQALTYPRL